MPSWSELLDRAQKYTDKSNELRKMRQEFFQLIYGITGRNVISYYSCWLKTPGAPNSSINDQDMNAFMNAVHKLDRSKGLDLILHTPGGDLAATESLINYLQSLFNDDIRVIVPQISMSAGTIISLSCKEIIMGAQSSLGPVDPQMGGIACQSIIEEYTEAVKSIASNPASAPVWQVIFSKYTPTFIISCRKAIQWSNDLLEKYINKVYGSSIDLKRVKEIFCDNTTSYSHSRHISRETCIGAGLNINKLENNQELQDAVLSLHHTYMILMDSFNISKIVENQIGSCYLQQFDPKSLS